MNVPNVFTPDGDGINEWFGPWGTQYSNFSFQVLAEDGHEVFFRTYLDHWDGADPRAGSTIPVTGRYFYRLRFTTANGTPIDVTNAFYLVRDRSYPCFRSETMLVFGDQFDPRRCGIIYPTNDRVCVE